MYLTSEAYKEQIREPVRNPCYIRVRFGIQDPEANRNAVITNNGALSYSSNPTLDGESDTKRRYGTLEPGYWLLDGSLDSAPDTEPYTLQGYAGADISSENGTYEQNPEIYATFTSGYYAFRGIGVYFDEVEHEHPVSIRIIAERDEKQVFDRIFSVEGEVFSYEGNLPPGDEYLNKITMQILDSGIPYRRARIGAIVLGVIKTLTCSNITEAKWSRKNDLMNTSIAKNEFSFTFLDIDGEYNPDNPEGIWRFLEDGQEVTFEYGIELDDGSIEWVKGGTNYTNGEPTISNSAALSKASFTAISRLQTLTDIYREGNYNPDGVTLYDLADSILQWAGLVDDNGNKEYRISEKLKNYVTTAPLPVGEAKDCLQLIANAGMCVVDVDRDGKIFIEEVSAEMMDFIYDKSVVLEAPPTTKKYPLLKDILVTLFQYTVQTEETELISMDIVEAEETVYELNFDDTAVDLSLSLAGGLTAGVTEFYANMCRVTLTGSGTVTVMGKTVESGSATVRFAYDTIGEECPVSNPLITSMTHAREYAAWVASVIMRRAEYTFKDRGFPEIDTTDNVTVNTLFTNNIKATVTENEMSYNGAFSGSSKLLVLNEVER